MKGTNPETQGHRWAKRVKKRLKKEQREDGQWEDLEREKAREAEEAAAAAAWEASASASASERADLDGATDLRDEEGLDPAELAAVRAVKAAAAAAAERLARLEKDAEATRERESNAKRAKRKEKEGKPPPTRRAPVSSNPFAALGSLRRSRDAAGDGGAAVVDPGTERTGRGDVPGSITGARTTTRVKKGQKESAIDARKRLAAEGAAAAVKHRRVLGIVGVSGSSAKKLKKQLKRARQSHHEAYY